MLIALTAAAVAQQANLSNDKIEPTLDLSGGWFSRVILKDSDPLSPLATLGHGEASHQTFKIIATHDAGPVHLATIEATLPLAQETLNRTIEAVDGENAIYVTSQLESALTVDRPISWAEHATIGPPFMEKGKVVVDMPATNCRVRPYKPGNIPGHPVYDKDFKWPMAPTVDGGTADIRVIPTDHNWLDLASCEMDPARRLAFVTALHLEKHLV